MTCRHCSKLTSQSITIPNSWSIFTEFIYALDSLHEESWFFFPDFKTRMGCRCLYARMGMKMITLVLLHFPITVHLYGDAGRAVLVGDHDRIRQKRSPTVHRDRQSVSSAPKDREFPPLPSCSDGVIREKRKNSLP